MNRLFALVAVCVLATACGSSPAAPTPTANITPLGSLTMTGCLPTGVGLLTCSAFSGQAVNTGPGCGRNVHGVTTTLDATTRAQLSTSEWSYGATVRPNEHISYAGGSITTTVVDGGSIYTTTMAWDSVACP